MGNPLTDFRFLLVVVLVLVIETKFGDKDGNEDEEDCRFGFDSGRIVRKM